MTHIQNRDSTLKKIHRKDIENKQQKYSGYNDIVDEFKIEFFDEDIDNYQPKQDEADNEVTHKIGEIMGKCCSSGGFQKDLSICQKDEYLFDYQKKKCEYQNSPPKKWCCAQRSDDVRECFLHRMFLFLNIKKTTERSSNYL